MKGKTILLAGLLVLAGWLEAGAQDVRQQLRFNPNYSRQDICAEWGRSNINRGMDTPYLQVSYTHLFWKHWAWRAGGMLAISPGRYDFAVGAPVSIVYRSGTASFEESLRYGLGGAVASSIWDGAWGNIDEIPGDILFYLCSILFRRADFFLGVTPGYYLGRALEGEGSRLYCTADLGASLCIPIWRLSLNITPAFHYSFTQTPGYDYAFNGPTRNPLFFSLGLGVSYLF